MMLKGISYTNQAKNMVFHPGALYTMHPQGIDNWLYCEFILICHILVPHPLLEDSCGGHSLELSMHELNNKYVNS